MSSRHPATVWLSLEELSRHGHLFKEPEPLDEGELVALAAGERVAGAAADGSLRVLDPSSPRSHR